MTNVPKEELNKVSSKKFANIQMNSGKKKIKIGQHLEVEIESRKKN